MKHSASNYRRDYKLPRSRILRGRESIQRLFREGRVLKERNLDMRYFVFSNGPASCHIGFIAGKRTGKAHERNTMKRRMREAYRLHQHLIRDITESGNISFQGIFIAKKTGVPYQEIERECVRLLTGVQKRLQSGDFV